MTCGHTADALVARSARLPQRLAGVVTVPPRQLTQLIQNPRLSRSRRRPVPRRRGLRNRLTLAHRQSHVRGCPVPNRRTPPPRRRRAFLHEATIPATRASLVSQLAGLTKALTHVKWKWTSVY